MESLEQRNDVHWFPFPKGHSDGSVENRIAGGGSEHGSEQGAPGSGGMGQRVVEGG